MKKLRIGTRGSALAVTQTGWVERRLKELHPGLETETVVITTSGDRFSAAPSGPASAFDKGLFVKEIEEALLGGRVDIGVHSSKDLPGVLPPGLSLGAFPERESPRDILITRDGGGLAALKAGSRVASSSLRRLVQLKMARPDLVPAPVRGNVDTRLKKLKAGEFEALILAEAGLRRLGRPETGERLEDMVPAPGQGALAVEMRSEDRETAALLEALDHAPTRTAVEAERLFLTLMEGGCRMPLGALGEPDGSWLRLSVFWAEPDGTGPIKLTARTKTDPDKVRRSVEDLVKRIKEISAGSRR